MQPASGAHGDGLSRVDVDKLTDASALTPRGTVAAILQRPGAGVLDFGCGYGRSLVVLAPTGVDWYGVDISESQLETAAENLRADDVDPSGRLAVINQDGRAPYADDYFDVIFSYQVLEHAADLDVVVAEIARLLAPDGVALHEWPAKWCVIEPHLRAPFVHWIPKGQLRRLAIHALTYAGARPPWPPELPENAGLFRLAEFEYRYSVNETFYRPFRRVVRTFERHGLRAEAIPWRKIDAVPAPLRRMAARAVRAFWSASLAVSWRLPALPAPTTSWPEAR
jgi:SAM-dependent methyltransferase